MKNVQRQLGVAETGLKVFEAAPAAGTGAAPAAGAAAAAS
jgi:hypothetical protein